MLNDLYAENLKNAEAYGLEEACWQMQEEAAELIQAISKLHRAQGGGLPTEMTPERAKGCIINEIVDVCIMVEQLLYLLSVEDWRYDDLYRFKVRRTTERRLNAE